jgi:hypothetical protein
LEIYIFFPVASFLFIIALDYVLRTSIDLQKDIGFTLWKAQSRRKPAEKIIDADYADDIALFVDKILDAEKLLHTLEEASAGIGLYVNARKTEFMTFNQNGSINTLDGTSLSNVESFRYLGSDISSTGKDISTCIN